MNHLSPKMLKHLTRADIEAICRLADRRRLQGSEVARSQSAILPSTENGQTLDQLMTRGLSPDHLLLLRQIQTLSREAVVELAALLWFGRGDASWEQIVRHAEGSYSVTLPYYLADKPLLAEYLRGALSKLRL